MFVLKQLFFKTKFHPRSDILKRVITDFKAAKEPRMEIVQKSAKTRRLAGPGEARRELDNRSVATTLQAPRCDVDSSGEAIVRCSESSADIVDPCCDLGRRPSNWWTWPHNRNLWLYQTWREIRAASKTKATRWKRYNAKKIKEDDRYIFFWR